MGGFALRLGPGPGPGLVQEHNLERAVGWRSEGGPGGWWCVCWVACAVRQAARQAIENILSLDNIKHQTVLYARKLTSLNGELKGLLQEGVQVPARERAFVTGQPPLPWALYKRAPSRCIPHPLGTLRGRVTSPLKSFRGYYLSGISGVHRGGRGMNQGRGVPVEE